MSARASLPTAVNVDMQCRANGFLHHTRQYQQNEEAQGALVVRRGAPFRLQLQFNAELNTGFNIVSLTVSTESFGQKRLERSWTLKELSSRLIDDKCPFRMNLIKSKSTSTSLCLQLNSGFDTPLSKYRISRVSVFHSSNSEISLEAKAEIILIYNPFHLDDPVFMGVDKERQEFVMEDTGMLFLRNPGTWNRPGKPWFFGQFESPVLECILLLLSKSELSWEDLADPVKVSRALSAVVNANDDSGLLVGNWSGNYDDGRNPTEWTGSLKIFQEFYSTGRPVLYGQCWVYSGCLTTAGRALGIPTRSVTNFSSAHDTHANLLIDRYHHSTGEPFEDKNTDSVWNFHVWNEMWMTRDDLGKRYNGWQAVDATPQEVSGGFFQTGPCPLVAIREGEVNVPHDANFIYSEVNACEKRWVTSDNGETWIEAHSDPKSIGEFISTKAVGAFERQDVTNLYKYKEGSPEEKAAFERARELARQAGNERLPPPSSFFGQEDPLWQLRIQIEGPQPVILFGWDASVDVVVKNISDRDRAGSCYCTAVLRNSAGKSLKDLSTQQMKLDSPASVETTFKLSISASDYTDFGNEEVDIVILAALVDTENRVHTTYQVIGILYPDLLIKVPEKINKHTDAEISVELKNDLPMVLTNAKFTIEAPGLRSENLEQKVQDIQPGSVISATFKVRFHRAGPTNLVASFSSQQVTGVFKQATFYVDYN